MTSSAEQPPSSPSSASRARVPRGWIALALVALVAVVVGAGRFNRNMANRRLALDRAERARLLADQPKAPAADMAAQSAATAASIAAAMAAARAAPVGDHYAGWPNQPPNPAPPATSGGGPQAAHGRRG
jgi:hypothetical protein